MTLVELIHDMSQLDTKLSQFEEKFGVKSSDFYKAINAGELEEFDALDEYRLEFIEWLSIYKMWLSLQEKYQQTTVVQHILTRTKNIGMILFRIPTILRWLQLILITNIFHQILSTIVFWHQT